MNMFRQQTRSLDGEASRHQRGLRQRLRTSPFLQTAVLGLAGLVGVAGASLYASRRAGEGEATTDVRVLTDVVAHTVLQPNLTDGVIQGDPDEIARFDAIVRERVLTDDTVRVKLWDDTGRIVYSDEPRLIGEVYEFEGAPQNFGFYVHGRGHSVAHESRQLIYGFMDSHLKPPEDTKTRLVTPPSK